MNWLQIESLWIEVLRLRSRGQSAEVALSRYNQAREAFGAKIKQKFMQEASLYKFLKENGYHFGEVVNVEHDGLTHCFAKTNPLGTRFRFDFHWDNQGGHSFWVGKLTVFFDLLPGDRYMHPIFTSEVYNILADNIQFLSRYEAMLIGAVTGLSELPKYR